MKPKQFSTDQAKRIGNSLSIDWNKIDLEQFRMGLFVELEHGTRDPETNVTNDDTSLTGKIARAHLKEFPDYYTRLAALEAEIDLLGKPAWSHRCDSLHTAHHDPEVCMRE